jgi:S-adenosylmethionine:tRNA ribosyltransferase-isomerase
MIAANVAAQRPADAKLLVADRRGRVEHWRRADFVRLFHAGDLVIANDAATLPASLSGRHLASGRRIEARLATRASLEFESVKTMSAVLFGLGDFRMTTEHRPAPPPVSPGDRLALGPLHATVAGHVMNHPRFVELRFDGSPSEIWAGLARHGRPVQYSHLAAPLALWDTWAPIAGQPVAFEPPSASFVFDWHALTLMRARGVGFATITHAAGLSSTGDPALDAMLPFDEPYHIPSVARAQDRRIVAVGTTVVRALEHAARMDGVVRAGAGLASGRIDTSTPLLIVDAIFSGTHERGTSHYELLRAFASDERLARIDAELDGQGYRTHEYGDSVFIEILRASRSDTAGSRFTAVCTALAASGPARTGRAGRQRPRLPARKSGVRYRKCAGRRPWRRRKTAAGM